MANKALIDRRRFLQIAGGAAAATALSSNVARAAEIGPATRTRSIEDVEHIVILMQENRSFDHYFGTLRGVRGFGDPHPAVQASGQSVWNQSGVLPFHPSASDLGLQFIEDLAHDWDTTHQALDNGRYDSWVPAKTNATMTHLDRGDIPFHYALADAFTICDQYHCSSTFVPGPYGLGPRVPMLVVSPWSRGGWVCSEVFDHTSLIRFVGRRFGVTEPNISAWRKAICGDLTSAFDFSQRNLSVPALPSTAGYQPPDSDRHASYVPVPPSAGTMPGQEPGVRPARPLPYDLRADGVVTGGQLTVTFASCGGVGAVFHVTSDADPRSYTVGAGASLAGSWPLSAGQDVRVHGPNGFYRQFTGTGPDVAAAPSRTGLRLKVTNPSSAPVRLTVADAYTGKSSTVTVRARAATVVLAGTERGSGWYDVSVTSAGNAGYLRRLAGHVETGRPSVSDPALGKR